LAAEFGNCYQPSIGTGPRCCYRSSGPLIAGARGSRSERYQIPFFDLDVVFSRSQDIFNEELKLSIGKNKSSIESLVYRFT